MIAIEPVVAPNLASPAVSETRSTRGSQSRWQLTAESLTALLQALDPDEACAVARYRRLHERLVFFFMRHRSVCPEDLADICINRLASKLVDKAALDNIEAFALGIARMVHREDQSGALRSQRAFSEAFSQQAGNESSRASTLDEEEEKFRTMEAQFSALPSSLRSLLSSYHLGRGEARIERRRQLAEELGISIGTLRKRVFDLQSQLRQRLNQARRQSLSHREEPEHS